MPTWPFGDPTRMFWYPTGTFGNLGRLVGRLEMFWIPTGPFWEQVWPFGNPTGVCLWTWEHDFSIFSIWDHFPHPMGKLGLIEKSIYDMGLQIQDLVWHARNLMHHIAPYFLVVREKLLQNIVHLIKWSTQTCRCFIHLLFNMCVPCYLKCFKFLQIFGKLMYQPFTFTFTTSSSCWRPCDCRCKENLKVYSHLVSPPSFNAICGRCRRL